jgi:tetratricopeptide (TPR) repeat protein
MGAPADNLAEIRLSIQKWKATSEQLREARTWIQKDRRDMASDVLKQALADNPSDAAVLFELAKLYFEQGAFERAHELLLRVLSVEPQHKNARQMLAAAYSRLGQHEQALALANWILEDDPDAEEAHRIAGLANLKANRLNEAMIHFRKWLVLSPDKVEAQKQYADVLMRLQEYKQAAGLYEEILQKKSTDAEVYQQLAICYAKLMRVEQTVATMVQALYVVGTPSVGKWFKDPGFDGVRTNKLFMVLERQITAPTMAGKAAQAGETLLDLNTVIDEKHLQQVQSEIKSKSQ